MDVKLINKYGEMIGWLSKTVTIFGQDLTGITKIQYDDEIPIEMAYGEGRMPIGWEKGNYKATASITIYKEELVAFMKGLPKKMRLQDAPPIAIPVTFEHGDDVFTDVLNNVLFTKIGTALEQGKGKTEIDIPLSLTHIDWNV